MDLLNMYSRNLFSTIYLVDIWMGAASAGMYYQRLASAYASKTCYVHTLFGANSDTARDAISKTLGPSRSTLVKGRHGESGMQTHMRTNDEAVSYI